MAAYYIRSFYDNSRGEDDTMIILILTGIISGIISGMGIGGGTVLIPALTIFLDIEQKTAQSINLIYFIPTAAIALTSHIKSKRVETKNIKGLILFGIIGAAIGSIGASYISSNILRKCFGGFLCIMGGLEIFKGIKKR